MIFLAYQRECANEQRDVRGLRHIFRIRIDSKTDAFKVIHAVLGPDHEFEFIAFKDRREFAANTDEAKALLGTRTGAGVAWMLLRQPALAGKVVKSVSIFGRLKFASLREEAEANAPRNGGVHLYFAIEDRAQ